MAEATYFNAKSKDTLHPPPHTYGNGVEAIFHQFVDPRCADKHSSSPFEEERFHHNCNHRIEGFTDCGVLPDICPVFLSLSSLNGPARDSGCIVEAEWRGRRGL